MGGNSSKKPFTQWDLIEFSNLTGSCSMLSYICKIKRES